MLQARLGNLLMAIMRNVKFPIDLERVRLWKSSQRVLYLILSFFRLRYSLRGPPLITLQSQAINSINRRL